MENGEPIFSSLFSNNLTNPPKDSHGILWPQHTSMITHHTNLTCNADSIVTNEKYTILLLQCHGIFREYNVCLNCGCANSYGWKIYRKRKMLNMIRCRFGDCKPEHYMIYIYIYIYWEMRAFYLAIY